MCFKSYGFHKALILVSRFRLKYSFFGIIYVLVPLFILFFYMSLEPFLGHIIKNFWLIVILAALAVLFGYIYGKTKNRISGIPFRVF